ncbi:GH36-type glycosyl hydrolase domain-containing protein [Paenibacillus sp. MMS20-IR301]|uniref:GH36-type glycosyl hydrolase domain-containing protein n=1 Tax=Paenibacillus sp. MMS20-IR301 TaxID=2895946 RepID=UPI0028E65D1B|nr:amylo-alpha-1,6-glucosidase [Paenibacillus sp. MMS20-IR301]WNS43549.1 amylo-alpha-1,6-glucosidase [Paenibacillus sp. MMS20-IR301]
MIFKQHMNLITLTRDDLKYTFLPSGDIFEFTHEATLINQFQGNPADGSANNIYLRVYTEQGIRSYPLLGIRSGSKLAYSQDRLIYTGSIEAIGYRVTFAPARNGIWFWQVQLSGSGEKVDVVYGQDIGVAGKGGVLANELYMSQYLDHSIWEGPHGYAVCSRQNQPQGEDFPYLQQGVTGTRAIHYSTDATQFFGLSYKGSYVPEALEGNLQSRNYQYELAYTALQTEAVTLSEPVAFAFYGLFRPTHPAAVTELEFQDELQAAYEEIDWNQGEELRHGEETVLSSSIGAPYVSPQWSQAEINAAYPQRKLEETEDGELLSFFTEGHVHVVLQPKELRVERPHGHIITTLLDDKQVDNNLISSTNYMYGLFNGQTVAGNTSFHKLLSTPRGLLNIQHNSGQRIYVRLDGVYRLLTLPAAYEMGVNFAKWHYQLPGDVLTVTVFTAAGQPDLALQVQSKTGQAYDYYITNQLVMGEHEFQHPVRVEPQDGILRILPAEALPPQHPYPGLHFDIQLPGTAYTYSDDRVFYQDNQPRNGTLLTLSVTQSAGFQLIVQGRLTKGDLEPLALPYTLETETALYSKFYEAFSSGFQLQLEGTEQSRVEILNETVWWYTHNAMTHFIMPHGLEQPGGAAWGTRDVCQGPIEYFLMTQHYELARNVLLTIYSHQLWESREWPQWFMFDQHPVQAHEWHGDVVLWPLKCISDYITATGDYSILKEEVGYHHLADAQPSGQTATILEHVKDAVVTIRDRFIPGTALINYAGGDWDDTLQPADEALKTKLVSAWTVALAFQVIRNLSRVTVSDPEFSASLAEMADEMKESFRTLLIKDGVIAGFAYFQEDGSIDYMLHPLDEQTGIRYRLLPMTRSIIAELVTPEQAAENLRLIDEHLNCPDGVRLMDRPARYEGGVSTFFRRAEQAASVGREISLQYVHAHIRYLEASAKLGEADRAWNGLFQINPINIRQTVPNAQLRQSNMYFSSSDGDFPDRYSYQQNFDQLRDGSVEVKGGWRLYSSGPGIYLNQLISAVLGIRFSDEELIIDPVLPSSLDGLRFTYECFGRRMSFIYHIGHGPARTPEVLAAGAAVTGQILPNPYRPGAVSLAKNHLLALPGDELHIYLRQ